MTLERAREALEVRMGTVLRALSADPDVRVTLLWDFSSLAGSHRSAWYDRAGHRVVINADYALQGQPPHGVNPLTPGGRRKHPHIIGMAAHEAAHIRFTTWSDGDREALLLESEQVREIAHLLEEPRVERRYLSVRPQDHGHLRASTILTDLSPLAAPTDGEREGWVGEGVWGDGWRAGVACLMTLARGDAGVLDAEILERPRAVLGMVLGEALPALEALWVEAINLEDGDVAGLIDVARRWVEVVGPKPSSMGDVGSCAGTAQGQVDEFADDLLDEPSSGAEAGQGEVGREGGEPGGRAEEDDVLSEMLSAMQEDIQAENELSASSQVATERQEQTEQEIRRGEKEAAQWQKRARVKAEASLYGGEGAPKNVRFAQDKDRRTPTVTERMLAQRMTKEFQRARFRDRTKTTVLSERPPGRLQGREAMLATAQRTKRMQVTAKPFKDKTTRHAEEPPLTVGIMTDTSGSMSALEDFATAISWALAGAVRGMGRAMSVAFDTKVTVVARPGEFPEKTWPLAARGAGEDFKTAFSLIDGALNLTRGVGPRLLFVISDGEYQPKQAIFANKALEMLAASGARVVWVTPHRSGSVSLLAILGERWRKSVVPLEERDVKRFVGRYQTSAEGRLESMVIGEICTALREGVED